MPLRVVIRLVFLCSFLVWVAIALLDTIILFSDLRDLNPGIPAWLPRAMMVLFVILLFYYYQLRYDRKKHLDFTGYLWQVFVIGLPVTAVSLLVRLVLFLVGDTKLSTNVLFLDIIYHINLALFLSFLIAAFTSWKRLILYQKTKSLINLWNAFELMLLFALLYDSSTTILDEYMERGIIVVLGIVILILSINVKWIAYLTTRQKWTSLLFLLLIFFYLYYFYQTVTNLSDRIDARTTLFIDFKIHAFSLSIFGFVMLYNTFSFFVIFFNLPTSSAFEQKLGEVVNFKRISQSVRTEESEESIYRILLKSAVDSSFADAAWIDIVGKQGQNRLFTYKLEGKQTASIRKHLKDQGIKEVFNQEFSKGGRKINYMSNIRDNNFRSILALPLIAQAKIIGLLVLLKDLPSGFNREMVNIIDTFTNQAGISIENFRLLEEAFQHERYKEELKIAKKVQDKLLPDQLERGKDFDITTFSQSADGVGGDYYDTKRIGVKKVALIIADVSGKGTNAAFHMAQMKGVFHSLTQQALRPDLFMLRANEALIPCLERGAFISAIYFVIDTQRKKIKYSRAGHCPILYYKNKDNKAEYLKDEGAPLGIVKKKQYTNFVECHEITYEPNDIMILYTDGITEAKNKQGEEYGYARLKKTLLATKNKSVKAIQEHLISRLCAYSGANKILDDYTTMVIKFKKT